MRAAVQRALGAAGLPLTAVGFARRVLRTDRPMAREVLEGHARGFPAGFDTAVGQWHAPHAALDRFAGEERGFAYECAGMFARLADLATGRAHAVERLLSGTGDRYAHLVHVGAGRPFTAARLPVPIPLPRTPLLRWPALDGAAFFGGTRALARHGRVTTPSAQVRIACFGRAAWFLESGDVDGVARLISTLPVAAHPSLWSGVGLACACAGATDDGGRAGLVRAAGAHRPHLAQGVAFVAAAARSGIVPTRTRAACAHVLGVDPEQAAVWSDAAAEGLTRARHVHAHLRWRTRVRALATPVAPS
ncbi:DUF1702 family protein [Actinosynnema sp. NPDC051121]|nr:DUF1702 family protein [Saccharothrix sp.]